MAVTSKLDIDIKVYLLSRKSIVEKSSLSFLQKLVPNYNFSYNELSSINFSLQNSGRLLDKFKGLLFY